MLKVLKSLGAALAAAVIGAGLLASCSDGGSSGGGGRSVSSVTLNKSTLMLHVDGEAELTATVTYSDDSTDNKVTWTIETIEGENVAEVTDGKVTAKALGKAVITASAGGKSAVCKLSVVGDDEEIEDDTDWFADLSERNDNILKETFEGKTELPVFEGFGGDTGVYVTDFESTDGKDDYKFSVSSGNYSISDGVLTAGDGETANNLLNCAAVIDFGPIGGAVEGCFEFSTSDNNNSINFFDGNTVAFKVKIGNPLGYEINYNPAVANSGIALSASTKPALPSESFTMAKDTDYKVYYKFDLAGKKMTLKINGTTLFDEAETEIASLSGVTLNSSNKGQRKISAKNIALCGTYSEAALALKAAKAAAVAALEAYGADADASLTESIAAARTRGKTAINAAKTEADVGTALENAKQDIDDLIASLNQTPDQARTEHLGEVAAYADEVKAGFDTTLDTAISGMIDDVVTDETTKINAIDTTGLDVINAIAAAKDAIDAKAAERRATKFTVTYNTNGGSEIAAGEVQYGKTVTKPAKNPTKDGNRFVMWTATDSGSEDYFAEVDGVPTRPAIYADITIYAKWKTPDATLTFGSTTIPAYTGDKYGDYAIPAPVASTTGKKAEWNPTVDLDAEITGNATFTSVTGDWKTNAELEDVKYIVNSDTSATVGEKPSSVLVNTELVNIAMSDSAAVYAEVSANKPTATLADGTKVTGIGKAIRGANVAANESITPLVVTAKEDVTVYLYLGVAATNYNGNRKGEIYNGATKVGDISESKNPLGTATISLKAGQTANITIKNTGSSGGGWMFYGAEAVLADTFSNCTVVLNKKTGGNKSIAWSSLKTGADLVATLATESDTDGDKALVGWAKTNGATAADDLSGETVAAGVTLNLYPVFQEPDVTIKYYVPSLVGEALTYPASPVSESAVSGSPLAEAKATAKLPAAGIEGYSFKGWYTDVAMTVAYDFDADLEKGELTLYAKYALKATAKVTFAKDGVFTITNSPTDAQLITLTKGTKFNTKEESKTIGGTSYTAYLKLESGTDFILKAKSNITVTVYLTVASLTVGGTDITATSVTGESGIYSYSFSMNKDDEITVARKASGNLYYIEVAE